MRELAPDERTAPARPRPPLSPPPFVPPAPPGRAPATDPSALLESLSSSTLDRVRLLHARGFTDAEIAQRLGLSPRQVEWALQ